jgi:hypothetical protein
MPCEDHDPHCTSGDTCGADGTCSSGPWRSIEDVELVIGADMNSGACEGLKLPRRFVRLWAKTQGLLDRARVESNGKKLKHGAQAYCRYYAARMEFRGRKRRRLGADCRAHVKETLKGVGKQLKCLHDKDLANCKVVRPPSR